MISSQACRQASFSTVDAGEIIAVHAANQTMFGMTVTSTGPDEGPGFICLSPGHPQLDGRPGVFSQSVIGERPVLHFPGAAIIPSPNLGHMILGREERWRSGHLLMLDDRTFVVAGVGFNQLGAWGTTDGKGFGQVFSNSASIGFRSWEVVIEGPGGEPHTLFTIDAS